MQTTYDDERMVFQHFKARTKRSAALFSKSSRLTPGGVNAGIKYFQPYPIFMARADGSHLWDVDGNEYVDYLMSYGALILGHGAKEVRRAVESVFTSHGTTVFGTPTKDETDYGETLRDIYHPDGMSRFTNSGLEATLLAVRLAKGFTRKRKVAKFEGHYHGAVDHLLYSYSPDAAKAGQEGRPTPVADSVDVDQGMLAQSLVLPFNDWGATEKLLSDHSRDIACVIMEPFEDGVIAGDATFMRNLRGVTRDLKIPLIFDEVKTGFRVRLGGASEFYSYYPDITCLGKIIGGGLPIGAVVGDSDIMEQLDPRKSKGKVFHSGTFNGNPLSISAGQATVKALRRRGRFESLRAGTDDLKGRLSRALRNRAVPHALAGEGAMFNFYLTSSDVRNYRDVLRSDLRLRKLIDIELISRGVYLKPENRFCLSLAHSAEDVRATTGIFENSIDAVMTNKIQ